MTERKGKLIVHNADLIPSVSEMDISFISNSNSNSNEYHVFPGFCDVHVHFREPGFSYKETINTGALAAAKGGFTAVCTMPNLSPVPDSVEHLKAQLDIIVKDACINVYPYGALTVNEAGKQLADLSGMAPDVIGFSDDGKGVQDESMMLDAMQKAASLGKIIAAHCEDNLLVHGGYIHDGEYCRAHGHKGICSASEWKPIERDLKLCEKAGCAYHVCHISCKESVELIRDAKASGVNVSCETAPHYLALDDSRLEEHGRFRMNPPIRGKADREALLCGIADGTIDMIATDHAPHSADEKSRGLAGSLFGITGIEISFPVMYTYLVRSGLITLDKLIELMSLNPRKRFGIPLNNDYTVWELDSSSVIDPDSFISMGKSTPFEGHTVYGKCILTAANGKTVYSINRR